MKAIIIARVSTEEQRLAGSSLPAQLFRLERYCLQKNYEVVETFSFDESAYKTKRQEFDKILKIIKTHKQKIAICFDKVDRLSRNIFDKRVSHLYEKAVNNEVELHFVSDGQIINSQMNAGDKFAFGMKLGLSKYYSDAISDNVKRVFEQKRRNGEWTGPVRIGYLNVPENKERRTRKDIILDPTRAHLIKKLFELYATETYSFETLLKEMTKLGLKSHKNTTLARATIENIIKDSFYYGVANSKTHGSYNHIYPTLISKDLFDRCQNIIKRRFTNRNKCKSKEFIFKGIFTCKSCGCMVTPEEKLKKDGKRYVYYSCTNSKRNCKRDYVNEQDILNEINLLMDKFTAIPMNIQQYILHRLTDDKSEVHYNLAQKKRIENELSSVVAKDEILLEAFLEQTLSKETYTLKHTAYQDQINGLNVDLKNYVEDDFNTESALERLLDLARRAKDIFQSSEPHEKRQFLKLLIQNPSIYEKKLYFSIVSPFHRVLKSAYLLPKLGEVDTFRTFDTKAFIKELKSFNHLYEEKIKEGESVVMPNLIWL